MINLNDIELKEEHRIFIKSTASKIILNNISHSVGTIEAAAEIVIADIHLLINICNNIARILRERDMRRERHQLVVWEEFQHIRKLLNRCTELDSLVSNNDYDKIKEVRLEVSRTEFHQLTLVSILSGKRIWRRRNSC